MTRFAECLPLILKHEGGYVDCPPFADRASAAA